MIESLPPCGFDTLEYSWVKATIAICTLVDYSVAKKCQHPYRLMVALFSWAVTITPHSEIAEMKPPYVCPGCLIHMYSNNMINR
jgi:hypothetical protein